jgi:HEAT repeat protein
VTGDGAAPGVSPRPLLDDLCAAGILVPAGPDTADTALRFPDHSFAAYLTAGALAHRIQDEASSSATRRRVWEYLDRQAWDPAWQEVFIFLAAQLAEPVPLLDLLIAPRAAPGGDDFFHHRLATAALCLPEIAPHLQAPLAEVIDAVTTRAFSLWWQRRHESAELAGLTRITRALPALGVLNAPLDGTPLQEWLCRRLRASHAGERQAAAEALVHAGSRVPAPSLLTCLGEMLGATDAATRQLALETVMGLGGRAAVPTLLARLADLLCDPASAPQAALAVRCLGSAAATPGFLERLTRLLDDADTAIRQAAARAVGGIGSPAATPRILERLEALLRAESPELRHASLEAVRCLGSAATTEPLVNGLLDCFSDTHESIRQGAVEALAQLNFAASRPALLTRLAALLSDPAAEVRETASRAARVLGLVSATPQALDRLTQQLGSGLAPSPPAPLPMLGEGRRNSPPDELPSPSIGRGAGGEGAAPRPPIDPDRLAESLTGTDEFAREEAARVAAGRGTAAATPAVLAGLLALLRSPETRTRQAAAEALGSLMEQGVRIFPDTERGWVAYTVAELTQKKMPARR